MTMPDERSRAVLWAGGLLVQLNGDRRVPMDIRQAATRIARHFPTVSDVAGASRLKFLGEYGSLFADPRDCARWEESCHGRPLSTHTRLPWPTEDADDGIDHDPDYPDTEFTDDEEALEHLEEAIDSVRRATEALDRRSKRVLDVCNAIRPEFRSGLSALAWPEAVAQAWVSALHFDAGTKSAAHLILEGRVAEAIDLLQSIRDHQADGV